MNRLVPFLLASVVLFACQEPLSPQPAGEADLFLAGFPVIQSASGGGVIGGGQPRSFGFIAEVHLDLSVTGRFQAGTKRGRIEGRVTCVTFLENRAWVGGVVTHAPRGDEEFVGRDAAFDGSADSPRWCL